MRYVHDGLCPHCGEDVTAVFETGPGGYAIILKTKPGWLRLRQKRLPKRIYAKVARPKAAESPGVK
jgi:hypothetical protein